MPASTTSDLANPLPSLRGGRPVQRRSAGRRRAPAKPFLPNGVTREPYVAPGSFAESYGTLPLEDAASGRTVCWRMGAETAEEFLAHGVKDADKVLFRTPELRVFFPIAHGGPAGTYFAVKEVSVRGAATLARVLKAIELAAKHCVAAHLLQDLGRKQVTLADVHEALQGTRTCYLLCRRLGPQQGGNQVFVR